MALDDLPLARQRTLDRLIRRMRLGPVPLRTRSRLLVVQIDGLPHAMLARAMAEGALPFLEWLVRRHGFALHRYDLYVVSDHGQVACVSYRDLAGGTAFERPLFGEFLEREPPDTRVDEPPRTRGVRES